jgi:non-heme chloroperoxidase
MLRYNRFAAISIILFATSLFAQSSPGWKDPSPHVERLIQVEPGVQLEVLDWGGSGRPILLLAGGGNTAHVFDDFAPRLRAHHHVYAVTRRGFGTSGYAAAQNVSDRLGKDVFAVIDALKLKKPILVGHSIAGAELSWIAAHHPDRVAGLVYLEAGYSYAFDDGKGASIMDMQNLHAPQPPPPGESDLVTFSALQKYDLRVNGFSFPEAELRQQRESTPDGRVGNQRNFPGGPMLMALIMGGRKYTDIPVPALFIFANPHSLGTWAENTSDPAIRAEAKSYDAALSALTGKQESSVESGLPAAHVITLPNAHHYVYLSNEAEVLRDLNRFTSKLH